jgi:hypothetical protein
MRLICHRPDSAPVKKAVTTTAMPIEAPRYIGENLQLRRHSRTLAQPSDSQPSSDHVPEQEREISASATT